MTAMKQTPIHESAPRSAMAAEVAGWLVAAPVSLPAGLLLADESHRGKVMIHGRAGERAVEWLGLAAPVAIGQSTRAGDVAVYRLRADQLFVNTAPGGEGALLAAPAAVDGDMITITDVTHGRAQLRLTGPRAAELLSHLCALDFHPGHFLDGTAQTTSVAKTTQLVIREDVDGVLSYSLVGARSLGVYLWTTIQEAARRL
jgi:sarcosine oxidase subunit gamma